MMSCIFQFPTLDAHVAHATTVSNCSLASMRRTLDGRLLWLSEEDDVLMSVMPRLVPPAES